MDKAEVKEKKLTLMGPLPVQVTDYSGNGRDGQRQAIWRYILQAECGQNLTMDWIQREEGKM